MWRMLLPYYLLFLISIILFLKTDIRILYNGNHFSSNWRASEARETLFSHVYGSSRYIVRLFLIRMCALSVLRIKFKS